MRKITRILAVILAVVAVAMPAEAKLRFGIKAGVNINSLHFSKEAVQDVTASDNRAGFTGGIAIEYMVPAVGIGFDLSAMYVHRALGNITTQENDATTTQENGAPTTTSAARNYIEIPLNLKWRFGLPVVGDYIAPYIFTGPSVAFGVSKEEITDAYKNRAVEATWNLGAGIQFFKHLQIGFNYGWGMTKALKQKLNTAAGIQEKEIGKINGWCVTAAYFF